MAAPSYHHVMAQFKKKKKGWRLVFGWNKREEKWLDGYRVSQKKKNGEGGMELCIHKTHGGVGDEAFIWLLIKSKSGRARQSSPSGFSPLTLLDIQ